MWRPRAILVLTAALGCEVEDIEPRAEVSAEAEPRDGGCGSQSKPGTAERICRTTGWWNNTSWPWDATGSCIDANHIECTYSGNRWGRPAGGGIDDMAPISSCRVSSDLKAPGCLKPKPGAANFPPCPFPEIANATIAADGSVMFAAGIKETYLITPGNTVCDPDQGAAARASYCRGQVSSALHEKLAKLCLGIDITKKDMIECCVPEAAGGGPGGGSSGESGGLGSGESSGLPEPEPVPAP